MKKKLISITKRILRQRIESPQINGTEVLKSVQSEGKEKNGVLANAKSTSKITLVSHECDGCQKQFQSHSSVLKHKHYCSKKLSESSLNNHTSTPVLPSKNKKNGSSKAQTKILDYDSPKTEGNLGCSNLKRKPDVLSGTSTKKSKISVPSYTNGSSHSSNSDSPKKVSKKSVSSSTSAQVLSVKIPVKPKSSLKNIASPTKSHRSTAKNGFRKESSETDEITVASEGRPVRSSRRLSMTLVMEDQVEASFLEALSPEQRVRVAEQKCPFCTKHYVYRSNFKRHLLEGCDTIDVDETSANLTPTTTKKLIEVKQNKEKKSSVLTMERKEKRTETLEKGLQKIGNKPLKKKNSQKEKTVEEQIGKGAEKKTEKIPQQSAKLQELKKSTEKSSHRKETFNLSDVPRQSNQKAKQIPNKKTEEQHKRNGNPFEGKEENYATNVKREVIRTHSDKFNLTRRNGNKPTAVLKLKKSNVSSLSKEIISEAESSDQGNIY